MTSLYEFFAAKADAFSRGDMSASVRGLKLPMCVAVGINSLYLENAGSAEAAFAQYRSNLLVEGYERSQHKILHIAPSSRGMHVLTEWTNLNRLGAEINQLDMSFFCESDAFGRWQITVMEILSDAPKRHWSGVPLVMATA